MGQEGASWGQTPALLSTKIIAVFWSSALPSAFTSQSSHAGSHCHSSPLTLLDEANQQKALALVGKQMLSGCSVLVSGRGILFLGTLFLGLLSEGDVIRTLPPDPGVNLAAISG